MMIIRVASMVGILSLLLVTGCVTSKPADFMGSQFQPAQVVALSVLPVVDHVVDRQGSMDLEDTIMPIAEKELTRLGYVYTVLRDQHWVEGIARGDFDAPSPEWIATLGPPTSRFMMALVLEESSSWLTFGGTGTAELTGYLFDKQSATLLWKNKELGRTGIAGFLGMMLKSMMEKDAIQIATQEMFRTLPDRTRLKP